MLDYPDYADLSDLALTGISFSEQQRNIWSAQQARLLRYERYYSGEVFQEYIEKEQPTDDEIPLFPAGINLAKVFCKDLADAMFGEWEDVPVAFRSIGTGSDLDAKAVELVNAIMRESGAGNAFWEAELDRNKFGGCILRASVALHLPHHIRWSRVRPDSFYPVWDPEDPDVLLEAWAVTYMTQEQARAKFGPLAVKSNADRLLYVEHWTAYIYETFLDGGRLRASANPFQIVPFVYIPRERTTLWWGDSLIEDIIALQDEINMSIADMGDVIRKNAHPIFWGRNIPAGFKRENFHTGSDSMWDLGRTVGDLNGEVGILEPKSNVLTSAESYNKFLLRMARDHAGTPAIAYGDDDGGGQRSGDTLEIRLRPLMAAIRRSRNYFSPGLIRLLKITAAMLRQKDFSDIPARSVEHLANLTPTYSHVLPKSRPAIIDEVVKLLSTDPPSISLETAVRVLDFGPREVELIRSMVADKKLWKEKQTPKPGAQDGKTSDEKESASKDAAVSKEKPEEGAE